MTRHKTGSFAIPFLITLLISLGIFGGAGFYVYQSMLKSNANLEPLPSEIKLVSENDTHSILFSLDVSMTKEDALPTFMLYYTKPCSRKMVFVGIPNDMLLETENGTRTVRSVYQLGGTSELRDELAKKLNVTIDRYISLNESSFIKACDVFGGVSFYVPIKARGISTSDMPQQLSSEQIEIMLITNHYQSEIQRASVVCSSMADMFSQCNGERVASNLDASFDSFYQLLTDTDVTMEDYKEHKHAFKYLLTNESTFPMYLTPTGTETDAGFEVDDRFLDTLKEKMK